MGTSEREAPHTIEYYTRSVKFEDSLKLYRSIADSGSLSVQSKC
jgi:hypothetical protein